MTTNVIRTKNYRDPWLNHLAIIEKLFARMPDAERAAQVRWIVAKYGVARCPKCKESLT